MPVGTDYFPAVAGNNGLIYCLGGWIGYHNLTDAAWSFNPGSGAWTQINSLPGRRAGSAGAVGVNGTVYCFGGYIDPGTTTSSCFAYSPSTGIWTQIAPMSAPRGYAGATLGADGRIYVLGGDNRYPPLDRVEAYDPGTNSWQTLAPMPIAREDFAVVNGPDGLIYAMGGFTSGGATDEVDAYDPMTNTWRTVTPMPIAREGFAGALSASDGRIFAIGGMNDTSFPMTQVDAYSPQGINPSDFRLIRGTLLSGGLGDLSLSDNQELNLKAGVVPFLSDSPVQVLLTGTAPVGTPAALIFQLVAQAQLSNLSQTIELYDFSANAFVTVDTRVATQTKSAVQVRPPNPYRFVDPASHQVMARVKYRAPNGAPLLGWRIAIDQAIWFIR